MSGYNLILKIQSLEKQLHDLGLQWGPDKHARYGDTGFGDLVAVYPQDNELPIYTRDAVLFCGSIEDLQQWINGIAWARGYDMLLRLSDEKKREKAENKERERIALMRKREDQAKLLKVLKATDAENRVAKK